MSELAARTVESSEKSVDPCLTDIFRKTGILPTLMEEWLDDVLNSDEDSQDEVNPTGTTGN